MQCEVPQLSHTSKPVVTAREELLWELVRIEPALDHGWPVRPAHYLWAVATGSGDWGSFYAVAVALFRTVATRRSRAGGINATGEDRHQNKKTYFINLLYVIWIAEKNASKNCKNASQVRLDTRYVQVVRLLCQFTLWNDLKIINKSIEFENYLLIPEKVRSRTESQNELSLFPATPKGLK